jgi:hypothetical protein
MRMLFVPYAVAEPSDGTVRTLVVLGDRGAAAVSARFM